MPEVRVPESSRTRERFLGARFSFSYTFLYIWPGMTMDIYWSAAMKFMAMQVNTLAVMMLPRE